MPKRMTVYGMKNRVWYNTVSGVLLLVCINILLLVICVHHYTRLTMQMDGLIERIEYWTNETIVFE